MGVFWVREGTVSPPWAESGAVRGLVGAGREVFTELGQRCHPQLSVLEAGPVGTLGTGRSGDSGGGAGILGAERGFWGQGGATGGGACGALD